MIVWFESRHNLWSRKNLLKSDWFIAIRTEIILEKMQLATVLWKINWLNWWCDWMWDSRSDAGALSNILKEVHQSFRINSVNCYRRNRNRNRLNWILTKSLSDRFVCFFYSSSEIVFNLIGLTSTVFHSELIEVFSCDTKKTDNWRNTKAKEKSENLAEKRRWSEKKRNGPVKIKITVKSIRKHVFMWFIHEWVREWELQFE